MGSSIISPWSNRSSSISDSTAKRKYDVFKEDFESDGLRNSKQAKGRPKNAWNPSRSRKLARLYLLTSLSVDEIVAVLRTRNFMPCKRDVQKQLHDLLQARPGKIRSRGIMTKVRLQLFKGSRTLSVSESPPTTSRLDSPWSYDDVVQQTEEHPLEQPETNLTWSGNTPLDRKIMSYTTKENKSLLSTARLSSVNEYLAPPNLSISQSGFTSPPTSKTESKQRRPKAVTTTITAGENSQQAPNDIEESPVDGRRIITFSTESRRASLVSIDSLRGRLASKTESFIGDVLSVLQNLTISGSTRNSSTLGSGGSWKASSRISVASSSERVEALPQMSFISQEKVLLKHKLLLPGHMGYFKVVPCEKKASVWSRTNKPAAASNVMLDCPVFTFDGVTNLQDTKSHRLDAFGHTILHAAAASGQRPKHLLNLINQGADIPARNSGGETFLHLVKDIVSEDCLYLGALLLRLQMENFDFSCRDDHGQTPLHNVTRQWVNEAALRSIVETMLSYKIALPRSRDNLGRTILGQIADVGLDIPAITKLQEQAVANDSAQYCKMYSRSLETTDSSALHGTRIDCFPNYGIHTDIETVEDLQVYEAHADLLRTINRAYYSPLHEQDQGRNGLHCLAIVSLTLPRSVPSTKRHEAYLCELLEAGVDPDNCDKAGNTPFMAFIIHTRDDEDDATTVSLLSRLCDAGANLNRRNRAGQTPLHLAVSLGKAAVTRFLLANGANIHARDTKGRGVIALGKAESDKTSTDAKLYARIMMCISFVADAGGVLDPSPLQEWGLK